DNPNTRTGVLVGVHEIELGDLGSGPNNIETLALTVLKHTEALDTNARIMVSYDKFGELFAFTQPEVQALVDKVLEKNPHLQRYPVEQIMDKIIEWYDGYCFGVSVGKFNPFAVTNSAMSIDQLVSLFVYTGYLTIRLGGHIGIPNGEMRQMWGKLLKIASSGSGNAIENDVEWNQLHADMYRGDIRRLQAGISEIISMMPNVTNNYLECVYGDIFRTYLLAKFFGRTRSPSESASPDFLSEIQSGMGASDLIITLPGTGRFSESLVVIIEFKRIEADKLYDVDYPLKRARQGLEQIIEKDYARSRGSSSLRLDIGIAMGCGKVVMRQRLWRRARGQLAATRRNENDTLTPKRHRGESVAAWDVRLNNADDSGWQDANGWKTALLPSEFRTALGS
ncbi:hypothetical protein GGF49_006186, partial [Coemansia sp. RSA 1853]